MFGYRTGEIPVVQVHVKKPKPFKWLRKLFRRLKFKHARFEDGKYLRGQRDIEKWHEDAPLSKADYPDHRWQVINDRPKSMYSRSRSRDPKSTSNTQANKGPHPPCLSSEPRIHQGPKDAAIFLNMDTIKHVLDSDVIGYDRHHGTRSGGQITKAEVHNRPESNSRPHRHDMKRVPRATRSTEESMWTPLTRGNTLQVQFSPVKTKRKDPIQRHHNCSYPPNAISVLPDNSEDLIDSNPNANIHLDSAKIQKSQVPDPHEHEHDNDLNHFQVFGSKGRFNRKPKKRKNRKRRPRRKGKYVELIESDSSMENLNELQAQGRPRSSRKSERVRQRRKRTLSNPLRTLAVRLQDLAGDPVFHPARYRGYNRFFDE